MRYFHFAVALLLACCLMGADGGKKSKKKKNASGTTAAASKSADTETTGEEKAGTAVPMPDLFVAAWHNIKPFDLEDYRGQVTALVFFTDQGG